MPSTMKRSFRNPWVWMTNGYRLPSSKSVGGSRPPSHSLPRASFHLNTSHRLSRSSASRGLKSRSTTFAPDESSVAITFGWVFNSSTTVTAILPACGVEVFTVAHVRHDPHRVGGHFQLDHRGAAAALLVLVGRPGVIQRKERGGDDGPRPVLGPDHAARSVITQGLTDRRPHDRLDTPAPTVDQHVLRGEAMARHRALRDFPIPQFIAQRAQIAFPQLGNAGRATDAHGIVAVG